MAAVGLATTQPSRESQVPMQVNRLGIAVKNLHENIQALDERLSFVLRSTCPTAGAQAGTKEKSELVAHAELLSSLAEIVEAGNRRLIDIFNRLEL